MQTPGAIRVAYDTVAGEYARHFGDELRHKPLDRELLGRFVNTVGAGDLVYDLGCGPGQTTAFLDACGVPVRGLDLSFGLLVAARRQHPHLVLIKGDMLALPLRSDSAAGVVAFYSIVHFTLAQLRRALEEMWRVLHPGGQILLAFHVGEGTVHLPEFLGRSVSLDFTFFPSEAVSAELHQIGFVEIEVVERDPYPHVEYPSRRAYLFARKRNATPANPET